ncbi:MAG: IS1634 family transposase [Sphaerochaeta sp.]|nr:IS1634 family transposase [Sphaerochaeta sp.]
MYIKKVKTKSGRTNIAISQSYRDGEGKSKSRVVKGLGYLDDLEKEHGDPWPLIIAELEALEREYARLHLVTMLPIAMDERLVPEDASGIMNFGYAALSKLYHELEIDYLVNNRRRYLTCSYNHNAIFKMLVYSRILYPGSKKRAWEQRGRLFDKMDFSLDDVYRSLDFFTSIKDDLLEALDARLTKVQGRNTSIFYYDVTNYYFEINQEDEFRMRGCCKENRPLPIVQMGLFMDTDGIPVSYKLFEGNKADVKTFSPALSYLRNLNVRKKGGRFIIVMDNGMFSGDNLRQIQIDGNGYIVAYSLRGGTKEIQAKVLDPNGYRYKKRTKDKVTGSVTYEDAPWNPDDPETMGVDRYKSFDIPYELNLSNLKGKKQKLKVDVMRFVIGYSQKYADRAREERERVIEKAARIAETGQFFGSSDSRKYVKSTPFSKEDGEKLEVEYIHELDMEKIEKDGRFDGYHAVMTSELDMQPEKVIRQYRGLWEIEETFRISKTELRSRPVYVSTKNHIEAHFLTCFIALTLLRVLDKRLDDAYSTEEILTNLRTCNAHYLGENIYQFYQISDCLKDIGKTLGIDFTKKYLTRQEIRNIIGETKKTEY